MEKVIGIYKITSPSGKVYIGQSWNIIQRWKAYRSSQNNKQRLLYNSFDKYGKKAHFFEILHELPVDIKQSIFDEYEILYMDFYKSAGIQLLNIREGGSRGLHNDVTKKLMGILKSGKPSGIKPMLGRKHSDEAKARISKANSGKKHSEERKKQISIRHKGKIVSEESKKRMSEAQRKYFSNKIKLN
jgi:group I intron endonuclease